MAKFLFKTFGIHSKAFKEQRALIQTCGIESAAVVLEKQGKKFVAY